MTVRRSAASTGSGQGGIWVPGQEAIRRAVVNEGVISQPLHGPAPGPGVPERVPRLAAGPVLLVSSSLKRRKAPLPWIARASLRPARSSVIPSAKSAMSWYQTQDGSGSMTTRSSSSRSTGVWPSMPVSAVQNAISPVSGLISQWCS
jgi:hypothetical protein